MELTTLNAEMQHLLGKYILGVSTRYQIGYWAAFQLKLHPSSFFEDSTYGQLIEYVLGRMIDDDWIPEKEYIAEVGDLLKRLKNAESGKVELL